MKTVTVIGGGTGSFVVLSALKHLPIKLNAIVTMMDSGGSTGKLRDQLGVLPPGDLRQCLVALSEETNIWRQLMLYRFDEGDLKGHNFGNILLSVLEKLSPNYTKVVDQASKVLKTKGVVIPVTFDKVHLVAEYADGSTLKGEALIDDQKSPHASIVNLHLDPYASPNPKALEAIIRSDVIIFSPGDLYTSIFPVLLVDEIQETIKKSSAQIISIMNLMTRVGQTNGYTATTHIAELAKYAGRRPNVVLMNNATIPEHVLELYKAEKEVPVIPDISAEHFHGQLIYADIISDDMHEKAPGDGLKRSLLRHDSKKLLTALTPFLV